MYIFQLYIKMRCDYSVWYLYIKYIAIMIGFCFACCSLPNLWLSPWCFEPNLHNVHILSSFSIKDMFCLHSAFTVHCPMKDNNNIIKLCWSLLNFLFIICIPLICHSVISAWAAGLQVHPDLPHPWCSQTHPDQAGPPGVWIAGGS